MNIILQQQIFCQVCKKGDGDISKNGDDIMRLKIRRKVADKFLKGNDEFASKE